MMIYDLKNTPPCSKIFYLKSRYPFDLCDRFTIVEFKNVVAASVMPITIVQLLHLTFILKDVCTPNKSTRGGVTRALSRCCAEICLLPQTSVLLNIHNK